MVTPDPAARMAANDTAKGGMIPCCPELIKDDHCDVFRFKRILSYPVVITVNDRRISLEAEVILHFTFKRCTLGLTLGDPAYSTTLLPGEKVRLATTDRRSRFTYDSETKLSYRSEQISEEQYYMTAMQHYIADGANSQSGNVHTSDSSDWNFHGDAHGSIGIGLFGGSADASTNANGSHNSSSTLDYLHEQKSHVQSAATQAVGETHKAHAVSIGEVSSRTHIEGESEDHFEASSREFSNPNHCHAVTFIFYRLNKKQKVTFELSEIERRVKDPVAPVRRPFSALPPKTAVSFVPQDVTAINKKVVEDDDLLNATARGQNARFNNLQAQVNAGGFIINPAQTPMDPGLRAAALTEVDKQLQAANLLDANRQPAEGIKKDISFQAEFSLPTAGIIVKGCLDDCDICEPLVHERLQLENDLLRKQIELLEKSQEYRCCPASAEEK